MENDQMNQTPAPEPKKSSSGMTVLVAILMLLIGGGIGYYVTKTYYPTKETVTVEVPVVEEKTTEAADETSTVETTADWKTYTNKLWQFSFKYPTNYSITKDNLPKQSVTETSTDQGLQLSNSSDKNKPVLTIYVDPAGWGYENYDKDISTTDYELVGKTTKLYYAEDSTNGGRMAHMLYEASNGHNYFIMLTHNGTENYLPEFKEILSTFGFSK